MITYVDASVLVRHVFAEPGGLDSWSRIDRAVASELVRIECLRAIDRARLVGGLADDLIADRRSSLLDTIARFDLVQLSRPVLDRAADPFPTALGSLDAIHLATAILLRDATDEEMTFATHDRELGTAARAMGFVVEGT